MTNENLSIKEFAERMNTWSRKGIAFFFIVDFEMQKPLIFRLGDIDSARLLYNINDNTNCVAKPTASQVVELTRFPFPFADYKTKYDKVRSHLSLGDSYLVNLTAKTEVKTPASLREMFFASKAKYKLWLEDRVLVFSPETFVRIEDGKIFAHPMKGTIDAGVAAAREKILADKKEFAEHVTIVDLIRNDLSTVASNVRVSRFRYIDEIRTAHKNLLQVSSEITGDLPADYGSRLGDILLSLLPAGSVSGAPKCKTVQIIRDAEGERRGYYTGVMGIFDGACLDSGVMIRYMESENGRLYYRSGGGITVQSEPESEYQEIIDKVYVPVD